jgi:hypothetical protein
MNEPLSQARRLRAAAQAIGDEPLSLQQLFKLHGRGGAGGLLVVLAIPCLLPVPGTGSLMSVGLFALAWMIWRYFPRVVMPRRVGRFSLPAPMARRALNALAWMYEQAARWLRPRMGWWVQSRHRVWLAPLVALMAGVIFLPIPLGNIVPAVVLLLIGLGLVFEDGLALLSGTVLGVALLVGIAALFGGLLEGLPAWWSALRAA